MVHFHAIDWVQHSFWDDDNKVLEVHKEIDKTIGEILEHIDDETTVIIMSDHGFGPTYKTIHISNWLQKIGMLKIKPIPFDYILNKSLEYLFYKILKVSDQNNFFSGLKSTLAKIYNILPGFIKTLFDKSVTLLFNLIPTLERKYHVLYFDRIDWQNTKAYTVGQMGVSSKEYDQVRNYIRDEFYKLKDEKGQPLIEKVYMKEEIFSGESFDAAPDIIPFNEKNVYYFHPDIDFKGIVTPPVQWRKGNHHPKGIFIINGPDIKSGAHYSQINIFDIAPTLLHCMGVPVLTDMDGKVFTNCFTDEFLQANPVHSLDPYEIDHSEANLATDAENEIIMRRLRGLGYL
jgi:predicted AlkP superfamily phosphohydrolase/phosphomutase